MGCLSSKTDSSDQKSRATLTTDGQSTVPKLDSRLPFQQYRDFFQLKNYWKAVRRREDASKCLFFRSKFIQGGGGLVKADIEHQAFSRVKTAEIDLGTGVS
ncbi:hypothetical protein T4D_4478 [Trichinella pseudospiralis]|uniref:Uncharacterized protein n=1 Tax=Trichinella pseudospiralis TaxID=6337 RepID=A0A0V1FED8_TRIPS|nr:hypothetical protein T4D_4478 [Trichinella pseudospiralis]